MVLVYKRFHMKIADVEFIKKLPLDEQKDYLKALQKADQNRNQKQGLRRFFRIYSLHLA